MTTSRLSESDRADMEIFLAKIEQRLPALGVDVRVPIAAPPESKEASRALFGEICALKPIDPLMPNRIAVLAKTQTVLNFRLSAKDDSWVLNAREQLLKDGVLVATGGRWGCQAAGGRHSTPCRP